LGTPPPSRNPAEECVRSSGSPHHRPPLPTRAAPAAPLPAKTAHPAAPSPPCTNHRNAVPEDTPPYTGTVRRQERSGRDPDPGFAIPPESAAQIRRHLAQIPTPGSIRTSTLAAE